MNTATRINISQSVYISGLALGAIPTHHGLTVALMVFAGMIAATLVARVVMAPTTTADGLF